jgi:hypothetical protein
MLKLQFIFPFEQSCNVFFAICAVDRRTESLLPSPCRPHLKNFNMLFFNAFYFESRYCAKAAGRWLQVAYALL